MTKFNFTKILVLLISFQLLVSYGYSPRIDMEYKGGNKRHIGRYGMLIPLYEPRNSLFFTNMFLMHDSKSSVEGNFGLGLRQKLSDYSIFGFYGFWDIRKIKNVSKKIHQATVGVEYLREKFEARFNSYIPQNKRFLVEDLDVVNFTRNFDPQIGQTIQTIGIGSRYEVPLAGFDIEMGGNVFNIFESHVAYYHFNGRKGAESIRGWRFRSTLYLFSRDNQRLDIQGELNYDNVRKWSNYLGIKFTWVFAKNNTKITRNSIQDKMTQMTIRDIDAVSNTTPVLVETTTENFTGYSPLVLSDEDQANLKNAKFSGDALFLNMDSFESEVIDKNIHSDATDKMVVLSINPTTKEIQFIPLLKSSGGVNTVATEKVSKLFKSKTQGEKILKSTAKTQNALIQSLQQGNLDNQLITTVGEIARDLDVDFWERNINVLMYRGNKGLVTDNIRNIICQVYGMAGRYHPIPLIATDPANRRLGLPKIAINMKLSKTVIGNIPQVIKDKIISEGGSLNDVEIFYLAQDLHFDETGNPTADEPATIRFHPKLHFNAPYSQPGYDRHSYVKVFVMPVDGTSLIPIAGGAPQDVYTHQVDGSNRWSPRNIRIPLGVYNPSNKDFSTLPDSALGAKQPPRAFYSLGINNAADKKPIMVTYHHLVQSINPYNNAFAPIPNNSDMGKLYDLIYSNEFNNPKTLLESINLISNRLDNTHGFIDRFDRFAALNSISHNGTEYVYNGV